MLPATEMDSFEYTHHFYSEYIAVTVRNASGGTAHIPGRASFLTVLTS
jgi:hypothetical protein